MSLLAQVPTIGYRWMEAASDRNGRRRSRIGGGPAKQDSFVVVPAGPGLLHLNFLFKEDCHV